MRSSYTLNVFKIGYTNDWIYNIGNFFRNLKRAWDRATKGYCDFDLWGWDNFHTELVIKSLEAFAKNLHGAPAEYFDEENNSVAPWEKYLEEIRTHLYNSVEDNHVQKNEYEWVWKKTLFLNTKQGRYVKQKYWEREKEITKWREEEYKKGVEMK